MRGIVIAKSKVRGMWEKRTQVQEQQQQHRCDTSTRTCCTAPVEAREFARKPADAQPFYDTRRNTVTSGM